MRSFFIALLLLIATMANAQTIERVAFSSAASGNDHFQPMVGAAFGLSASGAGGSLTITSEYGENVFHNEMSQPTENGYIPIAEGISVYPNPADYVVNIAIGKAANTDGAKSVEIYDISGRLMFAKPFDGTGSEVSVDVSSLKAGTYILKVGKAKAKMVKEN
ncbi:MAG: T9SS type A sorting domain-containing protein [Bacteroidales bacterium]|nr:T9SS type A sorting domain-containing protein [Bacteroidales bacterium]